MNKKPYRICSYCVMDTSDPDITFDENGVCNHCKQYKQLAAEKLFETEEERLTALNNIVSQIKKAGINKEYDCLIGLSGGVDSTYVALKCKELGLRPLAVHLDNGWNSEIAVQNIEHIVKILNIDLITHVIDWEEFKDMQVAYFKSSVIDIEVLTDHAIMALLFKTASQFNIKYIINGSNIATEGILPSSWISDKNDLKNIKAIHKQFGSVKIKTFPTLGIIKLNYYKIIKRIKIVLLLNYLSYNKENAKKEIKDKLKWQDYGGKHHESFFTRIYQSYILPEKFGVDKRRAHLSTLICSNQITRDDALKFLWDPLYKNERQRDEDIAFLCKKWNISKDEFNRIMQYPPIHYTDYPSYHNSFIYKSTKLIYKKLQKIFKPQIFTY